MQTLERTQELGSAESPPPRRTRAVVFAIAAVAIVIATAALAYAAGAANSTTKTVVKVTPAKPVAVAAKPTGAVPVKCIPGAAPGSCNIDEAKEIAIPDKPLDAATRTLLAQQLVAARAAAARYPTVASARAAGMIQAGQFSPLTGAHFINYRAMGKFDPANPGSYIYDGTSPTSKVIGLMYLSLSSVYPPEGFAGPNDHWHRHTNTCVIFKGTQIIVPFAADSDVTRAQCDAKHGNFMRETAWMVHAWVVPGWESPQGVFAHDNKDVLCADGTTHTDAEGFCKGT